ncbi:antitoxin Xre/MbcA/ParS toxin-binding domain-containing protein [Pararhodonellum marinum]|uniref:antitoxin Xre/MbcA/ParS toxin-binding domain-containing protein n=1 Tax=Pararhodonellum marinum TaxID=2755358 RepID=UPI00189047E3|nr:antitoxin Xre/MbcA/ParS toxin-binding domain-containing protein [Pararhodonellum marinum]
MKKGKKYIKLDSKESEQLTDYQVPYGTVDTFVISRGGNQVSYEVKSGFGYFLKDLKDTHSLVEVGEKLEKNLTFAEISPIIDFLALKMVDVSKAASVSPSTVSRWTAESLIGTPGSYQFFKMDEAIKKGMEVFGQQSRLKAWLSSPNFALGNSVPADLMVSMTGIELVHEAIDALHFGNVL